MSPTPGLTVVNPAAGPTIEARPRQAPISIITVWGASGVGKTLFAISSPYRPVLVLDTERGAKPYKVSGLYDFDHIQCPTWMGRDGLKEQLRLIRRGRYGTVGIDTGTQFCDWVAKEAFSNAPARKLDKQSMLVWGEAKHTVRQILMELMSKTRVIVLTAGSRLQPDGRTREARILEPVYALSDVLMELRREPNRRIPYGLTMPPTSKSRIMGLPPRLPAATWEAILGYIPEKPADWDHLAAAEAIPEQLLYPGLDAER